MLKITTQKKGKQFRLVVEGRLARNTMDVLQRCWEEAKALPDSPAIEIEFSDITFVDEHAKRLLKRMARSGVKLTGHDIQMKAILEAVQKINEEEKES